MIRWIILLLELIISITFFMIWKHLFWKETGKAAHIAALILSVCAIFISFSGEALLEKPTRMLTVTALKEKNEQAKDVQIFIDSIWLDGEEIPVPEPVAGKWIRYKEQYRWVAEYDERYESGTTQAVVFELPVALNTEICFLGNQWKGIARVEIDHTIYMIDTYTDLDSGEEMVKATIPHPSVGMTIRAILVPVCGFCLSLLLLGALLTGLIRLMAWGIKKFSRMSQENGHLQKLMKYQFLFEELVARDFKKKYKRTVLGIAWSVLSPLLTLLVMRIVFTQFFGRHVAHYTTYLFCGNLVFSYFNESTGQGMTSLMSNAGIFSKVNVPKYLFLFSKNVQTLINFGLTLCVFFMFCVIDNITFTWKFICLLYPIFCLVLFNLGVGLILSALFVFFRDIQYLWAVFTQLLSYLSAIFYTIDSYSYTVQCLFLMNPIYLFIRYFRKIVIEATIPTVWFHLLMLIDALFVLSIGSWMYKKYNTKFLYYV